MATRPVSDALGKLNSMRLQRQLFSDNFPLAGVIRQQAEQARQHRVAVADDHPLRLLEKKMSAQISEALNIYRDQRDADTVKSTRQMFGPQGLGAFIKPDVPDADVAQARALAELASFREAALAHITEGGFPEAVCRIVLAGMVSIGAFERRSLRLARLLAQLPAKVRSGTGQVNWIALLKAQACITAVAPIEALNALEQLLPTPASRENALAVSAAVMMIEPTLANPRSEIIEFLMGTLGADPERVIGLARQLTESLDKPKVNTASAQPVAAAPKAKPAAKKRKA
jgi:hypothetical protein